MKIERADIEAQRQKYIISIANEQKTLFDIETKMLYLLSTSSGKVLDDETLSGTLADSKERYNSINQRVKSAQEITAQLNVTRDQYRIVCVDPRPRSVLMPLFVFLGDSTLVLSFLQVATRGSILYFVIADLAMIDPMYQYSLPYFVNLFKACIKKSKEGRDLKERLENILQTSTDTIFANVSRGLFETHKLIFSFMICTQILRLERKEISDLEWSLLLRAARPVIVNSGNSGSGMERDRDRKQPQTMLDLHPNPSKNLISEEGWNVVLALDAGVPAFKDLAKSMATP